LFNTSSTQTPHPLLALTLQVEKLFATQKLAEPVGRITEATASGLMVEGLSAFLELGSLVKICSRRESFLAEVIRLDVRSALVRPFKIDSRVMLATKVVPAGEFTICPTPEWKGRMIDALANPIDGLGNIPIGDEAISAHCSAPNPMARTKVDLPIRTGVKVLDIFTPICYGQRIGIFAGTGVGKSTILSMLAHSQGFDTVVTILVGERGREVLEYSELSNGNDRAKHITVVSTSDESPMMRRLAPQTGMRIAEYFRDRGERVLLIVDSITRYAHACREVALAASEAPVARGYPPSVFTRLPELLERAGPGLKGAGSITGIFSVLVDGDDHNDPVADSIRGTLDGHVVLKRSIAEQGRYPAVDPLASISRLAKHAWTVEQQRIVLLLRALISKFEESRDLRAMGGYQPGADSELDRALLIVPKLYGSVQQTSFQPTQNDVFVELLQQIPELKIR
jgi:flagellum-specific ATP synthase